MLVVPHGDVYVCENFIFEDMLYSHYILRRVSILILDLLKKMSR